MLQNVLGFLSVMLTAVTTAAGLAHLMALPNKIDLPPSEYLVAQSVYRGWSLLGIVFLGALVAIAILSCVVRRRTWEFRLTATAGVCILLSLAVFFIFTFPANQHTMNWTMLPANWEHLRAQWEYSHAAGAVLDLLALAALVLSLLARRRRPDMHG